MKFTKNILVILGLLLQVGVSFAGSSQGSRILDRVHKEKSINTSDWEHNGPTREDILCVTKVENLGRENNLISAAKNGNLKSVEAFIVAGADVNDNDSSGWTVLEYATYNAISGLPDRIEIVKLLIANGAAAKNDKRLEEFFVAAVFKGNNEMAKALLALDISFSSDALTKAYSYAQITCSAEIANAIKELHTKNRS